VFQHRLKPAEAQFTFANPSGAALVHRETSGSPAVPSDFVLRGDRLSVDPLTDARLVSDDVVVRVVGAAPNQTATARVMVIFKPLADGSLLSGRNAVTGSFDRRIASAASVYGLPPQFVKAQVKAESDFVAPFYRYEPLTIDLKQLTGDADSLQDVLLTPQGQRRIQGAIYRPYAIDGPMVADVLPPEPTWTFTAKGGETQLNLFTGGAVPIHGILSRTGLPFERNMPAYPNDRSVVTVHRSTVSQDLIYAPASVFRKVGRTVSPQSPDPHKDGVTSSFPLPNQPRERYYDIDYVAGVVKLLTPLAVGETVSVDYRLVKTQPVNGTTDPGAGKFDWTAVSRGKNLSFTVGQTIHNWFATNKARRKDVGWLTGNDSESLLEFIDRGNGLEPLDTRLDAATAQLYGAASYGPLQVTLQDFEKTGRGPLLTGALAGSMLFETRTDWAKGLALAGVIHRANRATTEAGTLPCDLGMCTELQYRQYWAKLFSLYNPRDAKYSISPAHPLSQIADNAKHFEPR
jgi:hypothetical protein